MKSVICKALRSPTLLVQSLAVLKQNHRASYRACPINAAKLHVDWCARASPEYPNGCPRVVWNLLSRDFTSSSTARQELQSWKALSSYMKQISHAVLVEFRVRNQL